MSGNQKAILKNAKALFQKKSFDECLKELQPLLDDEDGDKNVNCLLLAAACYDNLKNEDKAVDIIHKVLLIDSKNAVAWQGLSQFCMKNPNRFYFLAVYCFLFLIPHYQREENGTKCLECLTNYLRILDSYRLERPLRSPDLKPSCLLVLASDNSNPFALEISIRLMIESAIFPTLDGKTGSFESFTASFTGFDARSIDVDLLKSYSDRLRDSENSTDTAVFTFALGESVLGLCQAIKETNVGGLRSILERLRGLSNRGLKLEEPWQRQGFLDVHISAVAAMVAYCLNDFARCDFILKNLIDFCRSSFAHVSKDVAQFASLPTTSPSKATDFLTPRLLYTPVRVFGDSLAEGETPLHRVFKWAGCLLLSNAVKSGFGHLLAPALKLYATECMVEGEQLTWPLPEAVLFTQSCLLLDDLTSLQKYVDFSSSRLEAHVSTEVSLRTKLVGQWVSLRKRDTNPQLVLQAVLSLTTEVGSEGFTVENHNLAGWLLMKLQTASPESALDHFNRAIHLDATYYSSHLNLGLVLRTKAKDDVRALQALHRSWRLVPGNPQIAHPLASTYCRLGKIETAYEVYKKTDTRLFTPAMFLNFGLIALRLKKHADSVPALQRVVRAQPKNPLAWEVLGESYMERGSYGIAKQSLEHSIELDPNRPIAHLLYAKVCTALEEYSTAMTSYDRVVGLLKEHKLHSLSLLAKKGLMEINVILAVTEFKAAVVSRAVGHIEAVLVHSSSLLEESNAEVPPWVWYYTGYALSLGVLSHDENCVIRVPRRLSLLLKGTSESPTQSEDPVTMFQSRFVQLAGLSLSLFLKSTIASRMARETVLAWISLGLLELSLSDNSEDHNAEALLHQMRAEACLRRALALAKQLPSSSRGDKQLCALAWFGLGAVYNMVPDGVTKESAYCFARAFALCSHFLTAGVSLASNLCQLGGKAEARRVLDLCQQKDSEYHGVWLVAAQLAAATGNKTSRPGEPNELQCLVRAAECGFNRQSLWQVLPRVFELLKKPTSSGYEKESLKLVVQTTLELLNRCIAFYPRDDRLWFNRGLLLQLSNQPHTARRHFERAWHLIADSHADIVRSLLFLAQCQQGKVDEDLAHEVTSLSNWNCADFSILVGLAIAFMTKGKAAEAKKAYSLALRLSGLTAAEFRGSFVLASLRYGLPIPDDEAEAFWAELSSSSAVNPFKLRVIARALRVTSPPPPPSLKELDAFLADPALGHEYFVSVLGGDVSLEDARRLLMLVRMWVYLRPDVEAVWTLFATVQRLVFALETAVNKRKKKNTPAMLRNMALSLRRAFTVSQPRPISELLTGELVQLVKCVDSSDVDLLKELRPMVLRGALFFPSVPGIVETAIRCINV